MFLEGRALSRRHLYLFRSQTAPAGKPAATKAAPRCRTPKKCVIRTRCRCSVFRISTRRSRKARRIPYVLRAVYDSHRVFRGRRRFSTGGVTTFGRRRFFGVRCLGDALLLAELAPPSPHLGKRGGDAAPTQLGEHRRGTPAPPWLPAVAGTHLGSRPARTKRDSVASVVENNRSMGGFPAGGYIEMVGGVGFEPTTP